MMITVNFIDVVIKNGTTYSPEPGELSVQPFHCYCKTPCGTGSLGKLSGTRGGSSKHIIDGFEDGKFVEEGILEVIENDVFSVRSELGPTRFGSVGSSVMMSRRIVEGEGMGISAD